MLRAQNGPPCYAEIFAGLLDTSTRKLVAIFDWVVGVRDRAVGALTVLSDPNQANASKLYSTGFENRPAMYETLRARVRHFAGQKYLDTTLCVNERTPVAAPASVNAAAVNVDDVTSKLKFCSIRADKSIAVPLFPEQSSQMPFASSHPAIHALFKELDDEYPENSRDAREKWATSNQEGEGVQAATK